MGTAPPLIVRGTAGDFRITLLRTQTFGMDAGAIFGIIPRPLWEKVAGPPDARNRMPLGAWVAVIQGRDRCIVVDAGIGWKLDPKFADIHAVQQVGPDWTALLAPIGLTPADVTDLFLTHLHFDHAGGATVADPTSGQLVPAFPNARASVQKSQLGWARRPTPRDRASYIPENWEPLAEAAVLHERGGPAPPPPHLPAPAEFLLPGLRIVQAHGHTPGLQTLEIDGPTTFDGWGHTADGLLLGIDIFPSVFHLHPVWTPAFDHMPLQSLQEKERLAVDAATNGRAIVFGHPPHGVLAATVKLGQRGPEPDEIFAVEAPLA